MEEPDHGRLRRHINRPFSPEATERQVAAIEMRASQLLGKLDSQEQVDILSEFATPLAVHTMGNMLGLPEEDHHLVLKWSHDLVGFLGGHCMGKMTASYSTGRRQIKYGYYHCYNKGCTKHLRIKPEVLEEEFKTYLNQFALTNLQQKLLEVVLTKAIHRRMSNQDTQIVRSQKSLSKLNSQKLQIIDSLNKGIINENEGKSLLEELRNKETVLKLEISESNIDYSEGESLINFIKHFSENIGEFWSRLKTPQKTKLQNLLFPEKVFYKEGSFGTTNICASFQLFKKLTTFDEKTMVTQRVEVRNHIIPDLIALFNLFSNRLSQMSFAPVSYSV
jgi:hypothetical protein